MSVRIAGALCRSYRAFSSSLLCPAACPSLYTVPLRHITIPKEISSKVEQKWKDKDGIPDEYSIIYRAPLLYYIKFTYGTSFGALILAPTLISTSFLASEQKEYPIMLLGMELIGSNTELAGVILALGVMVLQIGKTVFQYPLRIYNDPNKGRYIFVYQHTLPWKLKKEQCLSGEVTKKWSYFAPWKDSLYQFKNRSAILLEHHFRRPVDFHNLVKPKIEKEEQPL